MVGLASLLGVNSYLARSRRGRASAWREPDWRYDLDASAKPRSPNGNDVDAAFAKVIARLKSPKGDSAGANDPLDGSASSAPLGRSISTVALEPGATEIGNFGDGGFRNVGHCIESGGCTTRHARFGRARNGETIAAVDRPCVSRSPSSMTSATPARLPSLTLLSSGSVAVVSGPKTVTAARRSH